MFLPSVNTPMTPRLSNIQATEPLSPRLPPARVKAERVAVELPGLGRVDRRLVIVGTVALGLVVVVAFVWRFRGPVEGEPEADAA